MRWNITNESNSTVEFFKAAIQKSDPYYCIDDLILEYDSKQFSAGGDF